MSADIRLQVRVKNARILRAMRAAGVASTAEMCRQIGRVRWQSHVAALINFRVSPLASDGKWRPIAMELATYLRVEPEQLWPEYLQHVAVKHAEVTLDVTIDQFAALASGERDLVRHDQVQRLLGLLKPREREVIEMRFGLNGNGPHTLDQIAGELGYATADGPRMVEQRAMRRLRKKLGWETTYGDVAG